MKSTRFLLATLALTGAPLLATSIAFAAPAVPSMAPAAAPAMDARAVALLDQSVKAYAALDKLAQKFVIADNLGGTVNQPTSGSGTLQIQKPGNARLEVKTGDEEKVYVADGTNFFVQGRPTSYFKKALDEESGVSVVVNMIPSAASLPLGLMLDGQNPLSLDGGIPWQKVAMVTRDGLEGVSMQLPTQEGESPVTFQVYLDPKTHLVARVEASTSIAKKPGEKPVSYSNVTTFATDNSAITPATFQYVPPVGAKLITQAERPKSYDASLVVGAKPFALAGKTLEGKSLSLDDYKGKVVLLDFWATWCGPCIGELPNVVSNYKTYHPQGFDIVAVSLDEEEDDLRKFVKERELPWPQIFDGKGWETGDAQTYGVRAIPFTLLIGKDGNIAAVNPRDEELEPAIKAALAK